MVIQFLLIAVLVLLPVTKPNELANLIGGVFFLAPGLIILLISLTKLGRSLTANPVPKADGHLVTDGIYTYVRHPIYTGLLLATLATVVQSMSFSKLIIWLALLILLIIKSNFEERLLLAKFSDYEAYQGRTGRFLPRIGK